MTNNDADLVDIIRQARERAEAANRARRTERLRDDANRGAAGYERIWK